MSYINKKFFHINKFNKSTEIITEIWRLTTFCDVDYWKSHEIGFQEREDFKWEKREYTTFASDEKKGKLKQF